MAVIWLSCACKRFLSFKVLDVVKIKFLPPKESLSQTAGALNHQDAMNNVQTWHTDAGSAQQMHNYTCCKSIWITLKLCIFRFSLFSGEQRAECRWQTRSKVSNGLNQTLLVSVFSWHLLTTRKVFNFFYFFLNDSLQEDKNIQRGSAASVWAFGV